MSSNCVVDTVSKASYSNDAEIVSGRLVVIPSLILHITSTIQFTISIDSVWLEEV